MATIQKKSKGEFVKAWQKFLGVPIDGDFGEKTESATKLFQTKNNLSSDGIVGGDTFAVAKVQGFAAPRTFTDFHDLVALAEEEGFHVTSTNGGQHNVGSKHYRGLAIDVRTRDKTAFECNEFIKKCRSFGLIVRDERKKPAGQKVWSGAHLHIEI